MKVIVSGATGFIGAEVVQQCLNHPLITSVVALSRRALPESTPKHEKLKVVIIKDFKTYTDDVLQELAGAQAAIWCMGIAMPTLEVSRLVNQDYTYAAADNFARALAPHLPSGTPFRFLYLSGVAAEPDQTKTFLFLQENRRLRGSIETGVLGRQTANFETFVAKPALVLSKSNWIGGLFSGRQSLAIRIDVLATVLVATVVEGGSVRTLENGDLVEQGWSLLNGSKKA